MGGEIAVIPVLGFIWIVAVTVGIWVYDWRRQERLTWEARIRSAVDEAIVQMTAACANRSSGCGYRKTHQTPTPA